MLTWRKSEPRPAYRGNGIVLKDRGHHGRNTLLEHALGRPKTPDDDYAFLDVWDGKSYFGGYDPFCTLRCALAYARAAYNRGKNK